MWDKTFEALRPEIERAFNDIWTRVFAGTGHRKAKLTVIEAKEDSGYSPTQDEVILAVPGWGIQEADSQDPRTWPRWRAELVHEIAHAYEAKIRPQVTAVGKRLLATQSRFSGHGHDEQFWTSVEAIAKALGLDLQDVAAAL